MSQIVVETEEILWGGGGVDCGSVSCRSSVILKRAYILREG